MVTCHSLPWLLTALALGACGGSTGPGAGSSGGGADVPESNSPVADGKGARNDPQPSMPPTTGTVGGASGGNAPEPAGGVAGDAGGSGGSTGGSIQAYPGKGFVVHEWGTDTIVVGSDGSLQVGLHHEEEDLPAFVYDRLKAGAQLGTGATTPSVIVKMETPVTYFYSDQPRSIRAKVTFPQGVFTQWYPGVIQFLPPVVAPKAGGGTPEGYADPVLDAAFPFTNEMCRAKLSAVAGGELDWGDVSVLPRGTDVTSQLPAAPLQEFTWSYARAVDSNPVLLPNGEAERFLFYRGLGAFELPVRVAAGVEGELALENRFTKAIGGAFAIHVDAERGAFLAHEGDIGPGATLATKVPSLDGAASLDRYEEQLGDRVTAVLDATGLYHDEAVAMVNTWKRQWFRTPGVRVLYVVPQVWTDRSIPLTIEPQPDAVLRVMLIRVEVITPEQEAADVAALEQFGASPEVTRAYFAALGRFAEPRARRAFELAPSRTGALYMEEMRGVSTLMVSQ